MYFQPTSFLGISGSSFHLANFFLSVLEKLLHASMRDNNYVFLELLNRCSSTLSRSLCGEGYGTPLQYSCLENPMDGGAWWAAVHGVAKSWTRLSNFPFTFHFHALEKEIQCSCLENPSDVGAWWAVVYGVTQSQT